MPCSIALRAASSAASCAANGVDLREPLKPREPALDHATVLPFTSVMLTTVLLNVDWMWAMPVATFFLVFFLTFFCGAGASGVAVAEFLSCFSERCRLSCRSRARSSCRRRRGTGERKQRACGWGGRRLRYEP